MKIDARPTKDFFLDMLTRDITLTDCILDLIDNSVDSIMKITKINPMEALFNKKLTSLKKYKIEITLNEREIIIEDNSCGIEEAKIEKDVFRFGSITTRKASPGLSVYGIGMKRAFLKMGKIIIFETRTKDEITTTKIDVDKWKNSEEWEFEGKSEKNNTNKTGTKIIVKKLFDSASNNFSSASFIKKLSDRINEVYGIFLQNHLEISVNKRKAEYSIPLIAESTQLKPAIATLEKGGVKIKIIAGISHKDSVKHNGWYVFCNGRLILSGDKTELTGWGDGIRKFHASTNRFVGYVYFESKDVRALPWKTTKDNVDYDSIIYQYALKEMINKAEPVVKFLTKQYTKRKDGPKELQDILSSSNEISIRELNKNNQTFTAPEIKEGIDKKNKGLRKIMYSIPSADIDKVLDLMGDNDMSLEEVGKKTFYYYIKHEE